MSPHHPFLLLPSLTPGLTQEVTMAVNTAVPKATVIKAPVMSCKAWLRSKTASALVLSLKVAPSSLSLTDPLSEAPLCLY